MQLNCPFASICRLGNVVGCELRHTDQHGAHVGASPDCVWDSHFDSVTSGDPVQEFGKTL